MLQHWHPLCSSLSLGRKPVRVQIGGRGLVVFRTNTGQVGVLDDSCPHRRMKLSCGRVDGDCIVCPYHGWKFDRDGAGESPGTPKLHTQAVAYETREEHGYVWGREFGAQTTFPIIDAAEFAAVRPLEQILNAPLELVLDNFTEVEHAATVHKYIGYALADMHQVRSVVTITDDTVQIKNAGPQKPVPWVVRRMFGIPSNAEFHWEWQTIFSPVVTTYDEFWTLPSADERIGVRGRICVFFVPIDDQATRLVIFPSFRLPWSNSLNQFFLLFREIARQMVRFEIAKDAKMVDHLADKSIDIDGMKLSRFDRPLALHRERISRIYRGNSLLDRAG
jgi:phenylpropionate dioxygenase-like ring-hydroxylating dioxygenase large terminal subunit